MTSAPRRLLEDVIGELAEAIIGLRSGDAAAGLIATSVELNLPIEATLETGPRGPVVRADLPRTRTRTDFDRPVGRLALHLGTLSTEAAP